MFISLTPVTLLLSLAQLYLLARYEKWKLYDAIFLRRNGVKII